MDHLTDGYTMDEPHLRTLRVSYSRIYVPQIHIASTGMSTSTLMGRGPKGENETRSRRNKGKELEREFRIKTEKVGDDEHYMYSVRATCSELFTRQLSAMIQHCFHDTSLIPCSLRSHDRYAAGKESR